MKTNSKPSQIRNHENVVVSNIEPFEQLKRTVLSCMLWEDSFYEDGATVADRIKELVAKCDKAEVAELAIYAREKMNLRHVPLLLCRELARYPRKFSVANTLCRIIQRADELAEFLSIYWKEGKTPISKQVKKGLACAFGKFNEYQLAKYNRASSIKLRDVLFMVHAKPKDEEQAALWKKLVDNKLETPDTWEVALSAGEDKKASFERLLAEKKLGYMALLRNLRNMYQAEVDQSLVFSALIAGAEKSRALPFRFIAAARAIPQWEAQIDQAMQLALGSINKLPGKTAVLIDVSPSMDSKISQKSDLSRMDAAIALAILLRGICEEVRVFAFSNQTKEVPARQGMALGDAIKNAVQSNGTRLGNAVCVVAMEAKAVDRLIVFTDEESQDRVPDPHCKGYMINVATSQYGVGYGAWTNISGFSEAVIQYIAELESDTISTPQSSETE